MRAGYAGGGDMSDYADLKSMAECAVGFTDVSLAPDVILSLITEVERMTSVAYAVHGAGYMEMLAERGQLKAENEALLKDAEKWKIVQNAMDQLQADERSGSIWSICARLLISVAHKINSSSSIVTEEGVTIDDIEIGDWRVTVERICLSKEP